MANSIYILLGANLGNPLKQLDDAKELLEKRLGKINIASSIYESQAWGVEDQPNFYNQVLLLSTPYSAQESLKICQFIEKQLGRVRKEKWGARMIDIDILYFNAEIIDEPNLQIPHPYIADRKFTLVPLNEIAKSYKNPKLNITNEELLLNCTDNLKVVKI